MKKQSSSILVTGFIGLKGTAILAEHYKDKIDAHYPAYLSKRAIGYAGEAEQLSEAAKAIIGENPSDDFLCVNIAEGGLLTALWRLGEKADTGFVLDLRKIPIKQETVEICELLEVNPYHLCSGGSMAIIVPGALALKEKLEKAGVPAFIVGQTTEENAHMLINDKTMSHINRPEPDELERLGLYLNKQVSFGICSVLPL